MPKIPKSVPKTLYLGVDPGKSGGIVAILDGEVFDYTKMPDTELDIWLWITGVCKCAFWHHAVIEKVHAMPAQGRKQGASSMFTFGQGYGTLRMALTASGCGYTAIPPKTWQKGVGAKIPAGTAYADRKRILVKRAKQLFPKLPLWSQPKTKGLQESIADALLIAHYCHITNRNTK